MVQEAVGEVRGLALVTGVSSSPGYKIALRLASAGWEVLGVYNQHPVGGISAVRWDLAAGARELVRRYKPALIIHAAAIGDVDRCETEPQLCYLVNVVATREIASEAYRVGARVVYISTDYVFPGDRGLYREDDPPRPVNYYGLTKLLGEEAVLAVGGAVVRTAWIYGLGPGRLNFGRAVVERLSRGEEVRAVADQWGSPTLNTLLAEAVAKLAEREHSGVLHAAGPRMSRYEFALAIAEAFGLPRELVKPISMSEVGYRAPRPRDSSLVSRRAVEMLGVPIDNIDYALSIFKREWVEQRHAAG